MLSIRGYRFLLSIEIEIENTFKEGEPRLYPRDASGVSANGLLSRLLWKLMKQTRVELEKAGNGVISSSRGNHRLSHRLFGKCRESSYRARCTSPRGQQLSYG